MKFVRSPRIAGLVGLAALAGLALVLTAGRAEAQGPRRQPTPNATLKSTEVAPDRKVTFRIYAPKADEVSVGGDFGGGKMTKDDKGVWSLTVGPLEPDFYTYTFNVDGVRTVDPRNAMIKQGLGSVDSMFLVPGEAAEFEELKADVPHGEVRQAFYRSNTLDQTRSVHVYTPPGYEAGSERYPVFYLLHGAGDDDRGWTNVGRAGFILDNLIAAKKAVPMVVVMPNGSLPRPANMPRFTPGQPPSPELRAAMEAMQNRFTDELLKEIVPFVEKHYRVHTDPEHRAIAGLSMGGGQTWRLVSSHPDQFAYVGLWSAALFGRNAEEAEKRYEAFLKEPDRINRSIRLLSISCGDKDRLVEGSKQLAEMLEKHGIKNELHVSGGGHTWINWRHYLKDLAPRLFR